MGSFDVPLDDERTQLDAFVEEYRSALDGTLDCLTEEQARSTSLGVLDKTGGLIDSGVVLQRCVR
ncbi:MAG: hypothetical protein ACR2LF_13560 [Jatrophihabitantaceae bacterium]